MLKKLTAVILSAAMALSLTVFPVSADDTTSSTETAQTFDFRPADNAYITNTAAASEDHVLDTDGNYVIDKNAYWHDNQHGITFSGGDIIKLHVSGPVNITLGGCQYAGASKVKLMNGTDLVDQVDFAKGCLGQTGLDFTDANSMKLSYTGKTAADLTINYDGMAYLPVMVITPISTVLPKDIHWTTLDTDFMTAVKAVTSDSVAIAEINRSTEALGSYETKLNGYGAWSEQSKSASYTHTDGNTYNFTKSLQAGSGGTTKRCFYFTPQQACVVTVAYEAAAGRPMYIVQGGKTLASGEDGKSGSNAATITADITNPSAGEVYVYGGSSNKQLYGIFVDYYDPTVEVKHAVAGNITYAGSVDTSALKIVFEDKKDSSKTLVDFDTTNAYSTQLVQYRDYNIYVGNADGTKIDTLAVSLDSNSISVAKQDITHNITVLDVSEADVTGTVKVHDINNDGSSLDLSGVTLKFTDKSNAENVYTAGSIANDGSYTVRLMSGKEYTVTATGATGYDLSPLSQEYTFVAGDATPFKNILFTETLGTVPFSATVKVGSDKPYKTISDAITAIKKMTREAGEAGRVTIEIDPGTYTEQVVVDAPYVTLKAANEAQKPTIQFYYGIGYIYYSADGGYYSEDYAVAKTRKSTVTRWGAVCRVYGEHVNLENIIFKNTFSCEITNEELADGVEAAKNNEYSDVNNKPERDTDNYDPKTKTAVERAAAIAIDKNYCEAYNCEFISSQDTFYTNSIAYIKDCYIEGATDYIFGGNSVVFDGCTLAWHGYSDQATGGYLTANKNSNTGDNGYLLKNITVTNSKYYPQNKFAAGSWGRNWGGANCQVVFDGVTMSGTDTPGAWVKMGGELSTSTLFVNNVTDKTGAAVDVSGTTYNPNGTMAANNYTEMKPEDYFGGWTPPHYVASTDPTTKPTSQPTTDPTAEPTTEPSAQPTTEPSTRPAIKTAEKKDGNTYVTLENIESGVVIAVKYDGTAVSAVKTANVATGEIEIADIEADKVMVWNSLEEMEPVCDAKDVTAAPESNLSTVNAAYDETNGINVDFTLLSKIPVYEDENSKSGFVAKSDAIMPAGSERQVAPVDTIVMSDTDGAKVTESTGTYLTAKKSSDDGDSYNYGGLIYRVDTGAPGLYRLEVTVDGTQSDTRVAPTGMNSGNLTGTKNWDNAGEVPRTSYATWSGSTWTYDFGTGENFIEIEIEPTSLATASATKTVGVKSIKITPIAVTPAGDKPTIHILGDSTQKTYTFNETISAWGQTLGNYFDKDKVNVVNYSMGGRAMKSNYCEGRFNEILASGKQGDYVFIHSAHNDETISTNRFSRGAGSVKDDLTANNANYNKWLDMYVAAIKARGMTPVLVTAMPRVNGSTGAYSESAAKPNGFNPDSPANMRAKAASDSSVGLAELYAGAKDYYDKLDGKEVAYIYNNTEAGETPANNAANGANGDGTHYKEAAAKQFSRIILQSIYDQSVATADAYTDKAIMQRLVTLMRSDVQTAAASENHDWSAVFPEMASDVSAVDVVPGAAKQAEANYYYRNNIEKALQLGLLNKDTENKFKPADTITVGEYARGIEKAFGLSTNSLTSYTKTYAELQADTNAAPFTLSSVFNLSAFYELADESDPATDPATDDTVTVTVTQPTGGTVTIYNESGFNAVTADIPAGLTVNQEILNNDFFTFTAPGNVESGTDNDATFDNADVTKNYAEFRKSGSDSAPYKTFVYNAKADGSLIVYARAGDNKKITLENTGTGTKQEKYINNGDGTASTTSYGTVTFTVAKDASYLLYVAGGTGRLFGVKYEGGVIQQSTESLTVNKGDEVKAVVVPAANYVVDGITVDGEKHTGKEYTFTVNADATVSAVLKSEPALVATTMVATDAPLTREVMGAILYDAYQAVADKTNIQKYMAQNGGVPSPSDPNYDPNLKYEGSPYTPLTGWGALTDKEGLSAALYQKVKAAYNLGLIRPETGIARGSIAVGDTLQPTAEVTRAKAAKSLVFAFILTQPQNGASQKIPAGFAIQSPAAIAAPSSEAQTTVFTTAE